MYARTLFLLVAFFGVLMACRCGGQVPTPHVVVIGDAQIPLAQMVCANLLAYCPNSVPTGSEGTCEAVVNARMGLVPSLMPAVLNCEAAATSKSAFVACLGVASSCP
jgi:hypothetical protein